MVMQSIFPQRPQINANYNWIDFITANGYILFDGATFPLSTGTEYALLQSSIATTICTTSVTISGTCTNAWTLAIDKDFDVSPLQLPRSVEGDAIVRAKFIVVTTATTDYECYVIAKLRKWDGTTETEIASAQSTTESEQKIGAGSASWERVLKITVPRTHLKKGEQLRLTIEGWGRRTSGNNFVLHVKAVPTTSADRLMAAIPFKLDFL